MCARAAAHSALSASPSTRTRRRTSSRLFSAAAGSPISSISETLGVLDFRAEQKIVSDIETIAASDINTDYEHTLRGDAKCCVVVNTATRESQASVRPPQFRTRHIARCADCNGSEWADTRSDPLPWNSIGGNNCLESTLSTVNDGGFFFAFCGVQWKCSLSSRRVERATCSGRFSASFHRRQRCESLRLKSR
jgi:hypothetical protein